MSIYAIQRKIKMSGKNTIDDVAIITVNWLTARRTLGAVRSLQKYYPDLPLYIIDDGSDEKDRVEFFEAYSNPTYKSHIIYDPDTEKLKNIKNTKFIQVPTHRRHGESIDYAMKHINAKWIFHVDSDVRLKKAGVIEYMLEGIDDTYCGSGLQKIQHPDYPKVFNIIFLFRQDLLKKYRLKMKPIYELRLETSTRYFKFLTDKDYKIKFVNDNLRDYYVHLFYEKGSKKEDEWNKYY